MTGAGDTGALLTARHRALIAAMHEDGYDVLVVVGSGLLTRHRYLDWLLGTAPLTRTAFAVVDADSPIAVFAAGAADRSLLIDSAREHGLTVDVPADGDPLDALIGALVSRSRGAATRRVGIVGRDRMLDTGSWLRLREGLPGWRLDDASHLVDRLGAEKTPAEIERVREAARIAAEAYECVVREAILPEARAADLLAAGHASARRLGARDALVIVGDGLFHGADPRPTLRPDAPLLSVCVEVLGAGGYWAEQAGVLARRDLDARHERVARTACECLDALGRALRPGTTLTAAVAAATEVARRSGLGLGVSHGTAHGVGVGDADRPRLSDDDGGRLRAGMTLALHPNVADPGLPVSATVGGTYVVRADGLERLCPVPTRYVVDGEQARAVGEPGDGRYLHRTVDHGTSSQEPGKGEGPDE